MARRKGLAAGLGLALGLALVVGAVSPGCSSYRGQIVEREDVLEPGPYAGTWQSDDGDRYTIRPVGRTFRLTDAESGRVFRGVFFRVGGRTMVEIRLSDPDELGPGAAPVYHYGRVDVVDGALIHRPLNVGWFRRAAGRRADFVMAPLADEDGGSAGSVPVASGPGVMRELLAEAAGDLSAWDAGETFGRVEAD